MNIFTHIAQATETVQIYSTNEISGAEIGGAIALLSAFFFFSLFVAVIGYVIGALCLMRIFKKAGIPGWPAWVPIYNNWKMLEIGGQKGFWAILALVPVVNIVSIVMLYIAQYHIGLKLGKSGAFVAFAILLPAVWLIWLALDKSTWNDAASPAPSLHIPEVAPVAAAPVQQVPMQQYPVEQAPMQQPFAPEPVTPQAPVEDMSIPQAPTEDTNVPQPPTQNQQ